MKVFQSIRFRIIIACIFFSIVVSICYGWVTYLGLKYNSDELFNWFIAEEAQVLLAKHQQNPQVDLAGMTSAQVLVTTEQNALNALAEYFEESQLKEKIRQSPNLDKVRILGPVFTTEQGFIIYEFISHDKTIHVLKAALEHNKDGESFYYLVDVSEFINYDHYSEKEVVDMFLNMLMLIIFISLVIGLWLARRVVSPLTRLANSVDSENYQPNQRDYQPNQRDYFNDEIGFLAKRIDSFVLKANDMIAREKAFSRDVSHELRTPLASSRAAMELALAAPEASNERLSKYLQRAARANNDMSHLIETFLLLGRENADGEILSRINLAALVQNSFDKHDYLKRSSSVQCLNAVEPSIEVQTAGRYLAIVLDNLVRNAFQHTYQGHIKVFLEDNVLVVEDTGEGMGGEQSSDLISDNVLEKSGVGLSIVNRLCEKLDWQIMFDKQYQQGTRVKVLFNFS